MARCVLIFLLVGLFGCSPRPPAAQEETEEESTVSVDVAPVLVATIQRTVHGSAVLYPLQQAAITPSISAPVKKFYVERGSPVRAGQLLAELENRNLEGSANEAKAAYEQAEAAYETAARATVPEEVHKAELDVKAAKDTVDAQQKVYESRLSLFMEGAIAQKDVNDAQVALTLARNQYEIAQAHLASLQTVGRDQALKAAAAQRDAAKARYDTALAQLSYSRITSPINGVVTDRPNFAGETQQSGMPLITVMDLSQIVARAHISQQEAAELRVGDSATIAPNNDVTPISGRVSLISPALDPSNTTVEVWVQANNPGMRLKPGMTVPVEIVAKTVPSALTIPEEAVIASASGTTSVITVDPENQPQKKTVTLGIHDNGRVQVTEGLDSGQRVVTTGVFELDKLDEDVLAKTKLAIQAAPEEEEDEDEK